MKVAILLLITILESNAAAKGATKSPRTFSQAKKSVYKIFSNLEETTLYCGCKFKGKIFDPKGCGYTPKRARTKKGNINPRSQRIEIEHIAAAHSFGQSFQEWRSPQQFPKCKKKNGKYKSSRKCARTNPLFARMEADLYNLWPAIGEINGDRSNYRFAEIQGEKRSYGRCDVEIENRKVEPRPEVRGLIARAILYMDQKYPGRGVLQKKGGARDMLQAWNKQHPPTQTEKFWALKVQNIQGDCQTFIHDCKKLMQQSNIHKVSN